MVSRVKLTLEETVTPELSNAMRSVSIPTYAFKDI